MSYSNERENRENSNFKSEPPPKPKAPEPKLIKESANPKAVKDND